MSDLNEPLGTPNQNDAQNNQSLDYLNKAADACAAGDLVLGMHLYLAAYEKAVGDPDSPSTIALASLREAWHLACDLRERSMAEYVFEKMEPYLSGNEISQCAEMLQSLALDRLEQYGFSREDLQGMAEALTQEFGETPLVKFEQISAPIVLPNGSPFVGFGRMEDREAPADETEAPSVANNSTNGQTPERAQAEQRSNEQPADLPLDLRPFIAPAPESQDDELLPTMPDVKTPGARPASFTYRNLVGYDEAISIMRDYGVGLQNDRGFQNFVGMLNHRHGLDRMPALDTMIFRAPAREDAMRFVEATIGEIGLPAMRMSMDENIQGMPVLCVTTKSDDHPKLNRARNRFEGPGILVVEDIDLWVVPTEPENAEGFGGFMMANISRGAREALNFIRMAVDNPDVFVLVTASTENEVDPFFCELLEPFSVIDIGVPNDQERSDIWTEIARDHPSMRTIDRVDLMRYSVGMPRYDIYMAAREAIEEAYKLGLVTRRYQPVTAQNIFEKLAAYQPLDSVEYRALEAEVLKDFRHDLDHLEDLLDGPWE